MSDDETHSRPSAITSVVWPALIGAGCAVLILLAIGWSAGLLAPGPFAAIFRPGSLGSDEEAVIARFKPHAATIEAAVRNDMLDLDLLRSLSLGSEAKRVRNPRLFRHPGVCDEVLVDRVGTTMGGYAWHLVLLTSAATAPYDFDPDADVSRLSDRLILYRMNYR